MSESDIPEDALRLAEAAIFAAAEPLAASMLAALLPEDGPAAMRVLAALRARYAGRGVELAEVAGGWMFRTAPDLTQRLTRVVRQPRRLPRVAMEVLAIIAYHQPVTRPEIEDIRGASLSQASFEALLDARLVAPKGRKEVPGRPTLWGTTPEFLVQFGLADLRDLPRREELLVESAMLPLGPDSAEAQPAATAEDAPLVADAGEVPADPESC